MSTNIFVALADQAAWLSLLAAWVADFQPNHHAFEEIVQRLAEADWTAKRRKRDIILFEGKMDALHPDLMTTDWSAEEQKTWQTLVTRAKDADRAFLSVQNLADRHRKRRDDLDKEARKLEGQKKASAKPEPLVAGPGPEPKPLQQTGVIDRAKGHIKPVWCPTNAEVRRMFNDLGEHTVSLIRRVLFIFDPSADPKEVRTSEEYSVNAFKTILEQEVEPEPDDMSGPDQSPLAPLDRPFTREVVLR